MSQRKIKFLEGKYYHIFNRGVDKRDIFLDKNDLVYFLDSLVISNDVVCSYLDRRKENRKKLVNTIIKEKRKLVSLVSYALMPNHFHLVITINDGDSGMGNRISKFMQRLGTSYTRFFNEKYERTGSLFQGKFKAVQINKRRTVELTSVYVNLNYKYHRLNPNKFLIKTSLDEYINNKIAGGICDKKEIENIISYIGGIKSYKEYSIIQSKYFADNKKIDFNKLKFDELEN